MGAGASSTLSPVRHGFSSMSISFQCCDRITVLHLDDAGLSTIRQAINEVWPSGIQQEQATCGAGWSFKLSGKPFGLLGLMESNIPARRIVCHVLQKLYAIGWKVIGAGSLGRNDYRSTIFFERSPPQFCTRPFLAVGLQGSDKLKIVNMPVELVQPVKETIKSTWEPGIQEEDLVDGTFIVKLRGTPWKSSEKQTTIARLLLCNLIDTLHQYQWGYYCSVNFELFDLHSLIFHYDPSITFGESLTLCTIDVKKYDRLRVIDAPQEIVDMIRSVIIAHWRPGKIQAEQHYHGSWEFKLSGTPWYSRGNESARARYLVARILEAMQEHGWQNVAGLNCSRRFLPDKTTMVFQKSKCEPSPVMCLALNDTDKIRLINMPTEIVELVKNIIMARWKNGIQADVRLALPCGSVQELKLSGNPWSGGYHDHSIHGYSLLCNIFDEFKQRGWKLLLSADISSKYYDDENYIPMDPYSFWFIHDSSSNDKQQSAPTHNPDFLNFPAPQYSFGTAAAIPQQSGMPVNDQFTAFGVQPPSYFSIDPYSQPPPSYVQATAPPCSEKC